VAVLPFRIADNDDASAYRETGAWFYSNAQAYGPSSRYARLSDGTGIEAAFELTAPQAGTYDIFEIVPKTVNAANKALYIVRQNGSTVDSVFLDQNEGSGAWVRVGRYVFTAGATVEVLVRHTGTSTVGTVLRADAVKLQLVEPGSTGLAAGPGPMPSDFGLAQNYPNPFNPTTTITFTLPVDSEISLQLFDNLGRHVMTLAEGRHQAGIHRVVLNAEELGSGVYYYRLTAGGTVHARRMVLVR
jgi:hypothetical protein